MATTTIGGMTAATAANITGAALLEMEDSASASVKVTAATLRTQMFAGGTGYTAADPLTVGPITATTGTFSSDISLTGSRKVQSTSGTLEVIAGQTLFLEGATGFGVSVTVNGGDAALTIASSKVATLGGLAITVASAAASAGLRLPHGAAPTSPTNGDMWTTTAGLFVRINGATVGPLT